MLAASPVLHQKAALCGRPVLSKAARSATVPRRHAVTPRARMYENILETSEWLGTKHVSCFIAHAIGAGNLPVSDA